MRSLPILVLLVLTLATSAFASDGVLEINQTCAVQAGCFAGDTAGLPVTISVSGSYRLTSNLVVPNENTDGIQISTDDVGIDLNNFTIRGPVVCSGTPLVCSSLSGTGSGVETTSSLFTGHSVRNGSIRGMGANGVSLGRQSEAMNLRVRSNRVDGINVLAGSTVSGNTAYENRDEGIDASDGSTVSGNSVYLNRDRGIQTLTGSTVSGNTASENGDDGINASAGSTVSGNTAYRNGDEGIVVSGRGGTVSGNTAVENGGDGISSGSDGFLIGNNATGNTGFGLSVLPQGGYRENVISSNTAGTVTGTGVNLGDNLCNGVLCP